AAGRAWVRLDCAAWQPGTDLSISERRRARTLGREYRQVDRDDVVAAQYDLKTVERQVTQRGPFDSRHTARARAPRWRARSEPELRRELHDARIERRRDRPEAGRPELRRRCAKVRRVQQIEDFQTQLDGALTGKADSTHHREIDIAIRGPAHRI